MSLVRDQKPGTPPIQQFGSYDQYRTLVDDSGLLDSGRLRESFCGLKGNRLENVPEHQGSLWGTWQFNDSVKVGLGASRG